MIICILAAVVGVSLIVLSMVPQLRLQAAAPSTCLALTGCRYYLDCCGEGVPACYQETGLVHGGKLPTCPGGLPLRDLSIFCGPG